MTVSFVVHANSVRMRRITHHQEPSSHLFNSGFMPNYYVWTKHGERGIVLDNNVEEEDRIPDFAANYNSFFNDTAMGEPEEDTEGYVVEDDLGQMLHEAEEGCET